MTAFRNRRAIAVLVTVAGLTAACSGPAPPQDAEDATGDLQEVATSDRRWTGLAVAPDGRILVAYPRWADEHGLSVATVEADGTTVPYPDAEWNQWQPGLDPTGHFVCVQALWVDPRDRLWILDPANPRFEGVVSGGPKLIEVDLGSDRVVRVIGFEPPITPPDSYLNDVRVDPDRGLAFVTDSGNGALVVVDLASGTSRRVLDDHPATHAEAVTLEIGGEAWLRPDGSRPSVHADGLALSPERRWLYWQALTGRTMYRIPVAALADPSLNDDALALRVDRVAALGASDGIVFGPDGALYLTTLEHDAIRRWTPDRGLETVVTDPRIAWPDSFAPTVQGDLLFTTAQIHRSTPTEPFRVFRLQLDPDEP